MMNMKLAPEITAAEIVELEKQAQDSIYAMGLRAIGEDGFVPERKSWVDGMRDKPKSYHNNYEVVRFVEIQNELKAEQRKAWHIACYGIDLTRKDDL
jgi:hypothetical protein